MKLNDFKIRWLPSSALCVLMTMLSPVRGNATEQKPATQCSIEILSPKQGEHVTESSLIKGRGQVPAGKDLWVFVHVKGLALWWPQGAGPAVWEDRNWEVLGYFGGPQDIGRDFEISAAVLDPDQTNELRRW